MTEIKHSIQIAAPVTSVWPFCDLRRWPEFSDLYSTVSINTKILRLKTMVTIKSRLSKANILYYATISSWEENKKLAFNRFDGPLPGDSEWTLIPVNSRTKIVYTNRFLHTLANDLQVEIGEVMQMFLGDLKIAVEHHSPASSND